MRNILIVIFIFQNVIYCSNANKINSLFKWNQVVIWGHKLHTHTHSYIHNAFFRAFEHIGIKTLWLDDNDNISNIDLSNSLFITEGQVCGKMPLLEDSFYILHNCYTKRLVPLRINKNYINLKVYKHMFLNDAPDITKILPYSYISKTNRTIYMPWATDLLPCEIDENIKSLGTAKRYSTIYWIGTVGGQKFGNIDQLKPFIEEAKKHNIEFKSTLCTKSPEENCELIKKSYLAPVIVGRYQLKHGYIPCRIFKNISYGRMPGTNSYTVSKLFKHKIIFNPDTSKLFYDLKQFDENEDINNVKELMILVKEEHTYLNRILTMLEFIDLLSKEN